MVTKFHLRQQHSLYSNLSTAEQSSVASDKDAESQTINRSMDTDVGTGQVILTLSSLANNATNDHYFTRFVSRRINQRDRGVKYLDL